MKSLDSSFTQRVFSSSDPLALEKVFALRMLCGAHWSLPKTTLRQQERRAQRQLNLCHVYGNLFALTHDL